MHPLSILSLAIFVAGYTTARWDLVTRLYELAIFAWDHGVVVSLSRRRFWPRGALRSAAAALANICRATAPDPRREGLSDLDIRLWSRFRARGTLGSPRGQLGKSTPLDLQCGRLTILVLQHPRSPTSGVSAREQLRRRGSF